MRFWLSLSIGTIILSGVFHPHRELSRSRGIGDGGPATNATLLDPTGLALDEENLYIVESMAKRLRRVNLKTGIITTIAGGGRQCSGEEYTSPKPGCFGFPQRVAVDSLGDVYVTDEDIAGIVKIDARAHSFSTVVAGDVKLFSGPSLETVKELEWPAGITIDPSGFLFFDDHTAHTIYRLAFRDHSLEIVAGTGRKGFKGDGGTAKEAEFRFPDGIARDETGDLFIADYGNCRIQRIDGRTGIITTVAGTEEDGSTCDQQPDGWQPLDEPTDVGMDRTGYIYFVQPWRQRVQRVEVSTGSKTTVAGNGESGFSGDGGPATGARLHCPWGIAVDKQGNIYISDSQNNRVRVVDVRTGKISTVAGKGPVSPDVIL